MADYFAVILAGGGGTRLWPLSRQRRPKQAIPLLGERTLYQVAVDRLGPLFPPEKILVVTSGSYADELRAQRPQVPAGNFIIEPEPRGTAPALGLAAVEVLRRDPRGVMACLTADHFIRAEARFRSLLAAAALVAADGHLVTLGVAPTYAATGFGYIQRGGRLGAQGGFEVYQAARFKEKPALAEAEAMLADGLHSWNSGMFVWQAARLMDEFERQMPPFFAQLGRIAADPGATAQVWPAVVSTTIDYGIMEGAPRVAVIPADDLGWNDVGSWESLLEVLPSDEHGNVVVGADLLAVDTSGSLVHGGEAGRKLVALLGVSDMVVVDTGDVLLVCPKARSQEVRAFTAALKARADGQQYL